MTPEKRAEGIVRFVNSNPNHDLLIGDVVIVAAHMTIGLPNYSWSEIAVSLRQTIASAIGQGIDDAMASAIIKDPPIAPDSVEAILDCLDGGLALDFEASAAIANYIRHLQATVAFLARDTGYQQGYADGRKDEATAIEDRMDAHQRAVDRVW